jgi:nucleotide-binding universal stress UspA family protein
MYKKILVPLDGSELAECVLPHVEAVAKGCRVPKVFFIRVLEPFDAPGATEFSFAPENIAQKNLEIKRTDAENYFKTVGEKVRLAGIDVEWKIETGKVAETIAEFAGRHEVDLIIISTHGRSGVSRWVWGSVAERVLRSACAPVLMVRAPGCVPGF